MSRVEQGFAGHYCCAGQCWFRRNTLVNQKYIVSTVGAMPNDKSGCGYAEVGHRRTFETMVFEALPCDCGCGEYVAVVQKELDFLPANDAITAAQNHATLCARWEVEE